MKIGILAVQGAFAEHEDMLRKLEIDSFEIRKKSDLEKEMNGLILPGGESTAMGKILEDLDMMKPLKSLIENGMPVLATCAGMVLLAKEIAEQDKVYLSTMPVRVRRNAYGRQLGSFVADTVIKEVGNMTLRFIRAPYVETADSEVEILGEVEQRIIAVRYKNQVALSFHPELTNDSRMHEYFLRIVKKEI